TRATNIEENTEDKWYDAGLTVSYAASFGDFISATGYFARSYFEREDVTEWLSAILGTRILPAPIDTWGSNHTFVEEARFTSRFTGPVQFIMGIYIQRQNTDLTQNFVVPGINAASGGAFGSDLAYYSPGPGKDNEDAVYGEVTYHAGSHWSFTAGARESHVTTSLFYPWTGLLVAGTSGGGGETTANVFTPKAVVTYQQNDDINYYVLAAKGFRPGNGQVAPPPDFCV